MIKSRLTVYELSEDKVGMQLAFISRRETNSNQVKLANLV